MRLSVAIKGSLTEAIRAELMVAEQATTAGVKQATDGLKLTMRGQVTGSGLGRRLANTWRGQVYPKTGTSLAAAGMVWSNAPEIMAGLETTTVIRSRNGLWLAIPTPNAPKRGVGGKRISPGNFPEHTFGKLRFVYRPNGPSLLVVDNARASVNRQTGAIRGFRAASAAQQAKGRGLTTVVMFWLVPQVTTHKRIHFKEAALLWQGRLPTMILNNWRDS
jgi:hypothetical protein